MNDIYRFLQLLVIYSCICLIRSDPLEQPLIFHPETLEIYPNWSKAPDNGVVYAIACPAATSNKEIQLNQGSSLDHKSLFVRQYSRQKTDLIRQTKCEENYEMAVIFHSKSGEKFVEFGYEVYLDGEKFSQYFKTFDFKSFSPLMPPLSYLKWILNSVTNKGDDVKDNSDNFYPRSLEKPFEFIWVSKAVMKYDFSTWNVKNVTYFTTRNAGDLQIKCDNHNLGVQFYAEESQSKYYLNKNQRKVFNEVILPESSLRDGGSCQDEKYCVRAYSLLWPHQFQSSAGLPISCSDLPKIPIWYETAGGLLNYSEKFLYVIAEVTNQRLKVIAGTLDDILTFPTKETNVPQKIYLAKEKIPISKIIYKIVKYKSHECVPEVELCWFDLVIVIHNEPEVKSEDMLCEDKSQEWGWESIQFGSTTMRNEKEKSKFIYICKLDETMATKLGYKNDTPNKGDLNLNQFPSYNKDERKIEFLNWKGKFEERMRNVRILGTYV